MSKCLDCTCGDHTIGPLLIDFYLNRYVKGRNCSCTDGVNSIDNIHLSIRQGAATWSQRVSQYLNRHFEGENDCVAGPLTRPISLTFLSVGLPQKWGLQNQAWKYRRYVNTQ